MALAVADTGVLKKSILRHIFIIRPIYRHLVLQMSNEDTTHSLKLFFIYRNFQNNRKMPLKQVSCLEAPNKFLEDRYK